MAVVFTGDRAVPMKRLHWIKWGRRILGLAILIVMVILARSVIDDETVMWMRKWATENPVLGRIGFSAFYIVATLLFVPGTLLTLAAGAVFGLADGFVVASVSSSMGAAFAFLIARHIARDQIAQVAAKNRQFDAIDRAIEQAGWKMVALLRLSLAIPFNFQNYLLGLTKIPFGPYLITSWIAMIPGTFFYVYLGHLAQLTANGQQTLRDGHQNNSLIQWGLLILGLVATFLISIYVTALTKRHLSRTDTEPNGTV